MEAEAPPAFVPAVLVAPETMVPKKPRAKRRVPRRRAGAIEIEASGVTVRIGDGASPATITAVIRALKDAGDNRLAHRNREAQRRRSVCLPRRRNHPHRRRPFAKPDRRPAALGLCPSATQGRGLRTAVTVIRRHRQNHGRFNGRKARAEDVGN